MRGRFLHFFPRLLLPLVSIFTGGQVNEEALSPFGEAISLSAAGLRPSVTFNHARTEHATAYTTYSRGRESDAVDLPISSLPLAQLLIHSSPSRLAHIFSGVNKSEARKEMREDGASVYRMSNGTISNESIQEPFRGITLVC
jgi:hypothetical protein